MSALTDILVQQTDPVTAVLLVVIIVYVRSIRTNLKEELSLVRGRISRLEDLFLNNDGREED